MQKYISTGHRRIALVTVSNHICTSRLSLSGYTHQPRQTQDIRPNDVLLHVASSPDASACLRRLDAACGTASNGTNGRACHTWESERRNQTACKTGPCTSGEKLHLFQTSINLPWAGTVLEGYKTFVRYSDLFEFLEHGMTARLLLRDTRPVTAVFFVRPRGYLQSV